MRCLYAPPRPTVTSWRNPHEDHTSARAPSTTLCPAQQSPHRPCHYPTALAVRPSCALSAAPTILSWWTCRGATAGRSRKEPCRPPHATSSPNGSRLSRASGMDCDVADGALSGVGLAAWLPGAEGQGKAKMVLCTNGLPVHHRSVAYSFWKTCACTKKAHHLNG